MEITFDGGKVITAHIHGHTIQTDQPVNSGGENIAPAPFDLFLASIGTCAGIYIKSFCDNRKIPTDGIRIIQNAVYDPDSGLPTEINLDIQLPSEFPEKYIASVISVADLCKVKKTIMSQPKFQITTSIN